LVNGNRPRFLRVREGGSKAFRLIAANASEKKGAPSQIGVGKQHGMKGKKEKAAARMTLTDPDLNYPEQQGMSSQKIWGKEKRKGKGHDWRNAWGARGRSRDCTTYLGGATGRE